MPPARHGTGTGGSGDPDISASTSRFAYSFSEGQLRNLRMNMLVIEYSCRTRTLHENTHRPEQGLHSNPRQFQTSCWKSDHGIAVRHCTYNPICPAFDRPHHTPLPDPNPPHPTPPQPTPLLDLRLTLTYRSTLPVPLPNSPRLLCPPPSAQLVWGRTSPPRLLGWVRRRCILASWPRTRGHRVPAHRAW